VFVSGVVEQKLRLRLERVQEAVAAAIARGAPDLGGVEQTAHQLLAALQVWRPTVSDNGSDLRAALDRLQPVADAFGVTSADLFSDLVSLAQSWGPVAGVVVADDVRRRLRWRGRRETSKDAATASSADKIDADAVVRGPLEALNLQPEVKRAEELLREGDPSAVEAFAAVAQRLQEKGFRPHASMMFRKRAEALQAVGRADEAIIARASLVWDELDRAQPWEAGFALLDVVRPGHHPPLNASAERVLSAADAAVWRAKGADLALLVNAFDALHDDDPYRAHAATLLAEEAIAAEQREIVLDRLAVLRSIAEEAFTKPEEQMRQRAVRIRMCIADVTGEWTDLLWEVHTRQPREIVAWVHARWARFCALSGDGAGAQYHYLEAIDRASTEELFDDAADWLYALRTVRYLYGQFSADEQHPLAQALRPHAKPSTLPGSPHTKELALQAMLDKEEPGEALQRVERWRWQAVVRAELTDELRAVEAVGALQEKGGDLDASIKSYVRAGNAKKVEAAAGKLPDDHPARLDRSLLTAISPMRAAALAAAAAAADVLDDEEARAWTRVAIDEITRGATGIPVTRGAPALRAFDVLASMGQVLTDTQSDSLLELLNPIIDNPAKFGWESWAPTAEILLALSSRPSAPPMLARAIVADQQMAQVIIRRTDVLKAHRDVLAGLLIPFAVENRYACLAIIRSGADPEATMQLARSEVEQELAPQPNDEPNSFTPHVGAPMAAILASILDEETRNRFAATMLERALDPHRNDLSRRHDLVGLTNISINLDEATKRRLLPSVMEIANGQHAGEKRESFGIDVDFAAVALRCAAMLDPDLPACREIEQIGLTLLRDADDSKQWDVAEALVLLPLENSELDLEYCAVHPWAPIRALAAVRWAKNPAVLPYGRVRKLATDPDQGVRRELARAMRSGGTHTTDDETREIIAILRQDVRRSVRTPALQAAL
jgi:hypothetical protein